MKNSFRVFPCVFLLLMRRIGGVVDDRSWSFNCEYTYSLHNPLVLLTSRGTAKQILSKNWLLLFSPSTYFSVNFICLVEHFLVLTTVHLPYSFVKSKRTLFSNYAKPTIYSLSTLVCMEFVRTNETVRPTVILPVFTVGFINTKLGNHHLKIIFFKIIIKIRTT